MKYKLKTELAVNKLILLYLASRMPQGLGHDDFVLFNDEGDWMLYFDMEQYLLELVEGGLLSVRVQTDQKFYAVTAEGLNVLGLLKSKIPLSIRSFIGEKMAERRLDLERDQEITASYVQDSAVEFPVMLRIFENNLPLLELNLTAPSAEAAELVCRRFKRDGADIYASLIERLTQDEDKETS